MAYQVNGKVVESTETGYLVNQADWDKAVATEIARGEGLDLTQDHWDVIEYLRDQYFNHSGELPNNRHILKGMQEVWSDRKVDNKTLFDLFPGNPSKQAGRIAGLPESMRKGGY
ncbi:TusE/DsrC/DsvC family sulfur relay protein [Acidiferrobacter sp.]|jgi:tRNA 2-thiouridine synthesizing protein E|uniref:TusE/DsrC/DsvC family sulfur relay protein n=1 Tax=Acidiferrobacter sp. TaxID=1872107 RepID=UPI0026229899|nr:TusE/DsrC/DsvC family sulfur relay protein [Acidiferrobacter sp.]